MLRSTLEIIGYQLEARDGDIGTCKSFLFDDRYWTIRYAVIDTGVWLPGKKVLISPISMKGTDWSSRRLVTHLTRDRIAMAPELGEDAPVSREYEKRYHAHYGWPHYWIGGNVWASAPFPGPLYFDGTVATSVAEEEGEPNLRSVNEVKGYGIAVYDGSVGQVSDFIVDDETWTIRYVTVDTHKWFPGKKVLLSPFWFDSVDWAQGQVRVNLTRAQVKDSPEFRPDEPVHRVYETNLHNFYGRPHYWE